MEEEQRQGGSEMQRKDGGEGGKAEERGKLDGGRIVERWIRRRAERQGKMEEEETEEGNCKEKMAVWDDDR